MARGGKGIPRKSNYPNRSDYQMTPKQPIQVTTGQQYGKATEQRRAQQVIPLPQSTSAPIVPLDAPSARPNEPLTAGLPTGPGPGPEVLGLGTDLDELRAIYLQTGSEAIRELIEDEELGF